MIASRHAQPLATFLLFSAGLLGCGDDGNAIASPPPSGTADASTDGSPDASPEAGEDVVLSVETGADGAGVYGCSADMRAVVDAKGTVVTECPEDQGCLEGSCIPACQAAAGSHGNVGCDFFIPTPEGYATVLPPCFAMFVANTWPRPAKLAVTRAGQSFDVTAFARIPQQGKPEADWPPLPAGGLPQDGVAVLFLSHDPASVLTETGTPLNCPVQAALSVPTTVGNSGIGEAFHLVSDTPISAYDILPYGGAHSHVPSAELLYPTSAWGNNYVFIATPPGTYATPGLWGQVVAAEDDTAVQLVPTVGLPALASFPQGPAGQVASYTLQKGQYLQWMLPAGSTDLSGSVLVSDKPVAVFAGSQLLRLQPEPKPGGDASHKQIVAVRSLGSDYVAAPYATRRADLAPEAIGYRIVGSVAGTQLTFDPPVQGAPAAVGQGEVADFVASTPFRVKSQDADHPFAFAQLMNSAYWIGVGKVREGATAPGWDMMLGDEEFLQLLPPAQYLRHYVFFTDPTYPTTNLVITRIKEGGQFHDVTVDCLGAVTGWEPAGSSGEVEVAAVDLLRAGVAVNGCENGRHEASSEGRFGVVVWGLDSYSSYAYPAGGNAAQLSTITVPAQPK